VNTPTPANADQGATPTAAADSDAAVEPTPGMPATIHLYNDTSAAVVVRVNAKSIVVARVATDETSRRRLNNPREPFPVWAEDGILTEITGEPQRYTRVETRSGPAYRNGSISVSLGRSVSITDYRY
jgi:hypothetical protein